MPKKSILSCVACGKTGHLARKVPVPGYVDPHTGDNLGYECPARVIRILPDFGSSSPCSDPGTR